MCKVPGCRSCQKGSYQCKVAFSFGDDTSKGLESTAAPSTAALLLDSYGWDVFPPFPRYFCLKSPHWG